jgi:hypothetical protein
MASKKIIKSAAVAFFGDIITVKSLVKTGSVLFKAVSNVLPTGEIRAISTSGELFTIDSNDITLTVNQENNPESYEMFNGLFD